MEEVCEECGGFVRNDHAEPRECKGFEILENITRELYSSFFGCDQEFPVRRIICNESASYHGMAKVYRKSKPVMNSSGLSIRYDIGEIYLKRSVFSVNGYFDALATYIHEMCHVFGGDSSNAFSQGLTAAMETLLANAPMIESFRQQWLMQYRE